MTIEHNQFRLTEKDLRSERPIGPDILATAIEENRVMEIIPILARQIARVDRPHNKTHKLTLTDYVRALKILLNKDPLSFDLAQTTTAVLVHRTEEKFTDPNIFRRNIIVHQPSEQQLDQWNLTMEDVETAFSKPPILAGSLLLVHYDSMAEHTTWMRKVNEGPYTGRWTIRGGHYDNLSEIAAFEEAEEEAGITVFMNANPLGVADQVILTESDSDQMELTHYLNYMWELRLKHGERPINTNPGKPWTRFTDEEVETLYKKDKLTPIAECAFKTNRVFI